MDTIINLSVATLLVIVLVTLIVGLFVGAGMGKSRSGGSYR